MKPYTLTIRFRETDEYEAEVGAFMRDLSKHTDKSKMLSTLFSIKI